MREQWEPSKYQKAIFDWLLHGQGDGIVKAVAGSGKTTTLVKASCFLATMNSLFCAFNRHIVGELRVKIYGMKCCTIHSLGWRCLVNFLGKIDLREDKYQEIIRAYYLDIAELVRTELRREKRSLNPQQITLSINEALTTLKELIRFCRVTLTDVYQTDQLEGLIEHYRISSDYLELIIPYISLVLTEGERQARYERVVDYDDLIWLPYQWQLFPPRREWLFVDEAQDLNAAQLHLVLKARAEGGRILFVGDSRQAIYGFSGADAYSMQRIKEKTNAVELPLSVCYRCPKSHLVEAKEIVPEIESAPWAEPGSIFRIERQDLAKFARRNDLVICRLNAPLIEACINLISHKIPARVQGRDICKRLINIINNLTILDGFNYENFQTFLSIYRRERIEKLKKQPSSESKLITLNDECKGLAVCHLRFKCNSVEQLIYEIQRIFKGNEGEVILSTIHKAKGKEAQRVFILLYELLPLKWENQRDWEREQEINLKYVALTRSKKELYFVLELLDED